MNSTPYIPIDRLSPAQRPRARVEMRPGWHHLLFLHWAVEPEALRPLLPSGLELDLFEGKAYVGLVPFAMTRVRPRKAPHFGPLRRAFEDFLEVNVRTYVHVAGRDPGVWFWSLDAANLPAVCAARAWFKLPYFWARMRLQQRGTSITYSSQRLWPGPTPAACSLTYTTVGTPAPAAPGTLEHFLVERYILYSRSGNRLFRGRVHHAPYQIQSATLHSLDENLVAAAGIRRGEDAPLVHYAREVKVEIFGLEAVSD